jgi:cell division protein FtsB
MIDTIKDHPGLAAGIMGLLVAIVVYFAKKLDTKIDGHSNLIAEVKTELKVQLATNREDIKEDIIEVFNNVCGERQGACAKLQQAKLETLQATNAAICAKIARLDEDRREAWMQQRRWNDKIETTIYADKNGGNK